MSNADRAPPDSEAVSVLQTGRTGKPVECSVGECSHCGVLSREATMTVSEKVAFVTRSATIYPDTAFTLCTSSLQNVDFPSSLSLSFSSSSLDFSLLIQSLSGNGL